MTFLAGAFSVSINGTDVTSRWRPLLKSLQVERSAGRAADHFEAVLADIDGEIAMPVAGADIEAYLGHVETGIGWVFTGFVTNVSTRGSKSSGRELAIGGSSADHNSKVKTPGLRHKDNASFADVAQDWGSKAGLSVQVLGSLASLQRTYWIQQHESFMSWGQRMARELGATFKIIGNQAFFAPRNEGLSASGKPLTTVTGTGGDNLLSWDLSPIRARPRFSSVVDRHYDLQQAKWIDHALDIAGLDVDADFRPAIPQANADNAGQRVSAMAKEVDRDRGGGSVVIIGNYAAEPEAIFELSGARPGADGTYRINSLTHALSKDSGFVTSLTLRLPDGGAGVDNR